jgi:uncharacterized protein YndB with AHSA1/START domain
MTAETPELGTISVAYTVEFERAIVHPAERVWAALTEPALIGKWMDNDHVTVDLRAGGVWEVRHAPADDPWLPGVIVRLDPGRRLDVAWGLSINSYTIKPTAAGSTLVLVSNGNPFPTPGTDWTAPGVAAGWHRGLDALVAAVDGGSGRPLPDHGELTERYAVSFDGVFREAQALYMGPGD